MRDALDQLVGSRIRQRRIDRNLEVPELSKLTGIDPDLLRAYEDGDRRVSREDLRRICEVLETQPAYMFLNDHSALAAFRDAESEDERR